DQERIARQEEPDEKARLGEDDHEEEDVSPPTNQVVERVRSADDAGQKLHLSATCLSRPQRPGLPVRPPPAARYCGWACRRTSARRRRATSQRRRPPGRGSRRVRSRPST